MSLIDLHLHSTYSDGKADVLALANLIIKNKIKYCSLTDHETIAGAVRLQKYLKGHDVVVVNGLELTALYKEQEVHILAYDFAIDQMNKILRRKEKLVDQRKNAELARASDLFRHHGFSVGDNLKVKQGEPVGLTVALDIYNNPDNAKKISGFSPTKFYKNFQAPGAPVHVKKAGVSVDWVINNFKTIASDLILAHPLNRVSYSVRPLTTEDIKYLVGRGLDGIEVYHPGISTAQVKMLKNLARDNGWYYTGGSDYHGDGRDNDPLLGHFTKKDKICSFKLHRYAN